jgi:hypothetical protein
MSNERTLTFYHKLVQRNGMINDLLDKLLDGVIEQSDLEQRPDWPEIRQTIELFMFTGMVLESPRTADRFETKGLDRQPKMGSNQNKSGSKDIWRS